MDLLDFDKLVNNSAFVSNVQILISHFSNRQSVRQQQILLLTEQRKNQVEPCISSAFVIQETKDNYGMKAHKRNEFKKQRVKDNIICNITENEEEIALLTSVSNISSSKNHNPYFVDSGATNYLVTVDTEQFQLEIKVAK